VNFLLDYRRSADTGRGLIATVSGEAGVGKTRLLRQFQMAVEGGRSLMAFARCVEFVQTPLSPLRELLRNLERGADPDAATRPQ
jgi:predicted ATPase